jgi:hypothetical protein
MKYLQKSFTFAMSDANISQEDWDAIFEKKDGTRGSSSSSKPSGKDSGLHRPAKSDAGRTATASR